MPEIPGKEKISALGVDLRSYIELRGPITVHEFMSLALTHGVHGYYQNKLAKIGAEG